MRDYFAAHNTSAGVAFSLSHLAALLVFSALVTLLYVCRDWFRKGKRKRRGRLALAGILAACELALNAWYAWAGVYDVASALPLELCTISLYMCIVMLLMNSPALFRIVYYVGIGGALQALLTPALAYDFPHFLFLHFFTAHISVILAVLYMVWVEGCRPTLRSIGVTMVFLNVLLVIVAFVNKVTGGNYMFLARKPETASLLDVLGPHPWYILSSEGVALLFFLLMYAPFAIASRRKAKRPHQQQGPINHINLRS